MRALTIRQPYASLIALGVKTIETRSWRAPQALIGQTIAIHAGQTIGALHFSQFGEWSFHCPRYIDGDLPQLRRLGAISKDGNTLQMEHVRVLPLGVIIATATLADCLPMMDATDEEDYYGDFAPGRWAWMLTDVRPCGPIPAKGKQGLWSWQT